MNENAPHHHVAHPPPPVPTKTRRREAWVILIVVMLIVVLAFIFLRRKAPDETKSTAVPIVAFVPVEYKDVHNNVTIPAEFRPYVEAELDAKVSGYLQKINVDFGDRVKAGQLLAVLEVPELKDQLEAARATLLKAQVDYTNAHLMYTRLVDVNRQHPDLVAQQDIDTAQSKNNAEAAAAASAKAEMGRYQTMFDYTRITAPFDGVITRRFVDPGALIQAGTSSSSTGPVVRVSDNYRLRLDFPVSVDYVRDIHLGDTVKVRVDSLGGKFFEGPVTRFTDRVNEDTRTMITEIEVNNPTLEIVPGMYAEVVLKVKDHPHALVVPVQAVASKKNSSVYLIGPDDKLEEREVKIGIETPEFYEIASGLKEGDRVMVGSRSDVHPGQKVNPKPLAEVPLD